MPSEINGSNKSCMRRVSFLCRPFHNYPNERFRKRSLRIFSAMLPCCCAFVDNENAFDSVQTQSILKSLQEQVEDVYIEIMKYI